MFSRLLVALKKSVLGVNLQICFKGAATTVHCRSCAAAMNGSGGVPLVERAVIDNMVFASGR